MEFIVEIHSKQHSGPIMSTKEKKQLSQIPVKDDVIALSAEELGYEHTDEDELFYFEIETRIIQKDLVLLMCEEIEL